MKNQKVLDLVYLALFVGIIFIMAWVPWLGFIPISPLISVTLLHIPVLISIFVLGKKLGILTGTIFGTMSWILAMVRPMAALDPFFVNPLISLLPRFLFALLTVLIYEALKKLITNDYVNIIVTSIIGTMIHSVFVLGTLVIIEFPSVTEAGTFNAAVKAALVVLGTNSTLEAVAAALVVPPIVKALRTIKSNENKSSKLMDE